MPTGTARRLQREIRQTKPFQSLGHETGVALMLTTDLLRRHALRVLEPKGITTQQYNVLRILRGAGSEGLPTLEIAERMIEQTPGITRLLDRMEEKGWVSRQRCPEDRRRVLCYATPAGLGLLRELDAPMAAADRAIVGTLSSRQCTQLLGALERVRNQLRSGDIEA
jgi:DNA-binding MarR family transcriptional regulator